MGSGTYSSTARAARVDRVYASSTTAEIFTERSMNNAMDPHGVGIRESRDSEEHPNSVAIILGLDVTGSMGSVPDYLIREGLPHIMDGIIEAGMPDPQVMFVGIGDHNYDSSPLQIGQFESSDELLDSWLEKIYLEGGGGGNDGESYMLAWYFAAFHTSIDCFDNRNQKGYLFTVGDEPVLDTIPGSYLKRIMGEGQYSDMTSETLLSAASERYNVFHINVRETRSGSRPSVADEWRDILGNNLLTAERRGDIVSLIVDKVNETEVLENGRPPRLIDVAPE